MDFFRAQEKHMIAAVWKSRAAVPGIKGVFLNFEKYFISLMTYGPWKSYKSCERLNTQCLAVTNVHCWTEGNRGHVPCQICPGTRVAPQGWAVTLQLGHLAFLLCVFLINSLSRRAKLWWEAACFVVSLWGLMWAQSSVLGHASANILHGLSSIPANTDPYGLSEEIADPPKTSRDTIRLTGMQGTSCPSKVSLLTSGQLQNPFGLWETKVLAMKHSFISLLCWYLGQYKNKIPQIFHRPLI